MAGSLADFKYLDNAGRAWLIRIDKSNALATGTGFVEITQADLALDYLPRNIEIRYAVCRHPTRPIKRNIYCQSKSSDIWTGAKETILLRDFQDGSLQTFKIVDRIQEKPAYTAKLMDTYQNDNP